MNSGALLATAGCAFAVAVPAASADPINHGVQIDATCSGQAVTVAVNGNGDFLPAHDVADTSVFIPTALDLTFVFTPTGGSPEPSTTNDSAKAAPITGTITCTIPLQSFFSGPQGSTTIEGTVTGFWTPRG